MKTSLRILTLLTALVSTLIVKTFGADRPAPSPASAVVVEAAARQLAQLVESFVERDQIVGAELLVMQNGEPVLHRAFGLKDREAKLPMERDTAFAIRSMTKPFTGMAAQLLIDEGKLELDAPVAKYLPSFDHEKSRAIAVRHLLTHRSGLPLGFLTEPTKPLGAYSGLRELADISGARGPESTPGTRFLYSDAGSDVLGAIVAAVAGVSLEEFITKRILDPLELHNTFPEKLAVNSSRRERVATRYAGMAGSWTRYWGPTDVPLYPFLKGSGGLFATPRDYARFLQFWLDRGIRTSNGHAILSAEAFSRALTGASRDAVTTGFPGSVCDYAQMWMLFRRQNAEATAPAFAFGHGGSDGTVAYAFPEHKLIVCYFTQSRGTPSTRTFEEALGHLFVAPNEKALAEILRPSAPGNVEEFLGLYTRDGRAASAGAMIVLNGGLAFELATRQLMMLRATADRDRWIPERAPNDSIVFRRHEGKVVGFTLSNRGNVVEAERFRPALDLPTTADLEALRAKAIPPEQVKALLPLRLTLSGGTPAQQFSATSVVGRDRRSITEIDFGAAGKMRRWNDGERAWRQMPGSAAIVELSGFERAEEINTSMAASLGEWGKDQAQVLVLARETFQGAEVLRVRTVPRAGFASTKLVSLESGAVLVEYDISVAPGAGFIPTETRYADFRTVDGVLLPFRHTVTTGPSAATAIALTVTRAEPRAAIDETLLNIPQP